MAKATKQSNVSRLLGSLEPLSTISFESNHRRLARRASSVAMVLKIITFVLPPGPLHAGVGQEGVVELLTPGPPDWRTDTAGPLCGIYAACTALRLTGSEATPDDYVTTRYVGDCQGSTADEIAEIVSQSGRTAQVLARLSMFDLLVADSPVICNVRNDPSANRFTHWVVAVPSRNGLTIYDGPHDAYEVTTAEFLGTWSGLGVVVPHAADNPLRAIWLGRLALLQVAVCVLALLSLQFKRFAATKMMGRRVGPLASILLVSVVLALAGNLAFGDLLNHAAGVDIAAAPYTQVSYRTGDLSDVTAAAQDSRRLLIDARREEDFAAGSIDGAVNIPVYASRRSMRKYLKSIDFNTPIVVFCQSSKCAYDEGIAESLVGIGYNDVTVSSQGWAEYQAQNEGRKTK